MEIVDRTLTISPNGRNLANWKFADGNLATVVAGFKLDVDSKVDQDIGSSFEEITDSCGFLFSGWSCSGNSFMFVHTKQAEDGSLHTSFNYHNILQKKSFRAQTQHQICYAAISEEYVVVAFCDEDTHTMSIGVKQIQPETDCIQDVFSSANTKIAPDSHVNSIRLTRNNMLILNTDKGTFYYDVSTDCKTNFCIPASLQVLHCGSLSPDNSRVAFLSKCKESGHTLFMLNNRVSEKAQIQKGTPSNIPDQWEKKLFKVCYIEGAPFERQLVLLHWVTDKLIILCADIETNIVYGYNFDKNQEVIIYNPLPVTEVAHSPTNIFFNQCGDFRAIKISTIT